ncbi:MAG: alpha/beta hydrolase [Jatrophihabitantaceae bacterium]
MSDRFLTRQLVNLAVTANAIHPIPGEYAGIPAFAAGWGASELAPHLLAVTITDAAVHLARHGAWTRRDRLGLAAAAFASAGYVAQVRAGNRAGEQVERALQHGLGVDYAAELPSDEGAAMLAWRSLVNPLRMRNVDVTAKRRLAYAPGGRRFELDVYHHRDTPPGAPVLLQIHGGGWVIGQKEQQGIPLMMHMAARGWVCVAVNYPLSPRNRWPAHLIAIKRAIGWIRKHAVEYGGDPSFLAVTGGSAGGHLAAMVALTPDDKSLQPGFEGVDTSVQACVPHYGMYDFTGESGRKYTQRRADTLLRRYIMAVDARYPDDYRSASPLSRITADAPPFFVLHGSNDTLVPVPDAREFVEKLRSVSHNPVVYAELAGAQHAYDLVPSVRGLHVTRAVERFLGVCVSRAEVPGSVRQQR